MNAVLFTMQPIIYGIYIKNTYKIDWKAKKDDSLIKERWNGFSVNLAFFIHSCTDISILTFMNELEMISVYSVYSLVVVKLNILINSIVTNIEPIIGHAYAKGNKKELNEKLDLFEFAILALVGFIYTITGLMITPFVMIYTSNVTDADYYQPLFGVIIVIAEALYLIKAPHVSLAYSANKFKEITVPTYIEAAINIVVSILLVGKLGLIGVAIGTAAAMLYRLIFQVFFTSKILTERRQIRYYKKFLLIIIASLIGVLICRGVFPLKEYILVNWIVYAILYVFIIGAIYIIVGYIFFKKECIFLYNYIRKKNI